MAASQRNRRSSVPLAGVIVGGIIAGVALPRVLKASRLAARRIGATTFVSGSPGVGAATADPARGRPA
jgi:hypothetical protein